MSRRTMRSARNARTPARREPAADRFAWITDLALYASIAIVLARAMMMEIIRDPFLANVGQPDAPRAPGASIGLVLDLLSCGPALAVLLRGAIDPSFVVRRSLAHALMFILAAVTILSPLWAADKFLAAVSAAHFATALVVLWTFSQLVRGWREFRLVSAAALGLLLVLTARGLIYRFVELPVLIESVTEQWDQILQQRGWEADSFIAQQFFRRVTAGEVMGFSASPNTMGAMLVMLGVVAAGLVIQRLRDRDEYGFPLIIGLALVPAAVVLWFTGSRTALLTPFLAAGIIAVGWLARSWIIEHRRLVFAGGVAAVLLGFAAIVAHGMVHGTLFHDSLTFRWKYWLGSWPIFAENPWLGVGFANYGLYYLGARLPIAAEEISDPHNFIVRIFVELGLVGGAVLVAWMLRLWWELTLPQSPADPDDTPPVPPPQPKETIVPLLWLSAGAGALSIVAAVDFTQDLGFAFDETLKRLLYVILLLLGLTVGTFRSTARPEPDARPAPLLLYAVLAAIAVFLVHNLIDFSLFETGAMMTFMMLTGAAMGIRLAGGARAMGHKPAAAIGSAAAVGWLGLALAIVGPVMLAERHARRGDELFRAGSPAAAANELRRASELLWIPNGDYAFRAARAMIAAGAHPDEIRTMVERARTVAPMTVSYPRLRADFEARVPVPDRDAAIAAFERVVELDPADVPTRVDFAEFLEYFNEPDRAREQYHVALELNDQLHPDEPQRLTEVQIAHIEQRLRELGE